MLKFALVLGLGFVFLAPSSLPYNQTHAQVASAEKTENQIKKEQLISRNNFFQVLSSMAYVILWPLVALAGLAMDNQLIYGSFMQLDVSLWNIWQIVRSFANYAL